MAYSDYAGYLAALERGQWFSIAPTTIAVSSTALLSGFRGAVIPPTVPSTAVVPPRLTSGAFSQPGGDWRLAKVRVAGDAQASVVIIDRLSHQGGLDGTSVAAQTTNLPTAALTRYTSGEGVMAALEINTNIGTGGATVVASYTNTTPTAGRTTEAVGFGISNRSGSQVVVPLPLQSGDTGVVSVESVTLSGSSGTAGNFGVLLYMPLTAPLPLNQACDNHVDFEYELFLRTGNCPLVLSDACLSYLSIGTSVECHVDVCLIPE